MASFYTRAELEAVGLGSCGNNVRLSRFARIYSPERVFLGDEVRIDDFAILSPGSYAIELRGYNHLAAGALLFGPIEIAEYSTLSSRVAVYGISDDFGTHTSTYPYLDHELTVSQVRIGRNVVIGTGSTVLPGVEIVSDVAVGAMSLVNHSLGEPGVWVGIPARRIRSRE